MGKKTDYVADKFYKQHIHGSARKFIPNPVNDRSALLQRYYIRKLSEMCIARFKWHGLPESVDERFLERTLFYNALAVYYYDPRYGAYMALPATQTGNINVTDNPTRFTVYGNNFPSINLRARDCVPIWANIMRTPDIDVVLIYASKLAEIDRTIEINTRQARRSRVVSATEDQRLTVKNVLRQIDEGQDAVFINDALDMGSAITTVDLSIDPEQIERLHIVKARLWNEAMMSLGINGSNQDKKERLVSAEVGANDEQINMNKVLALKERQTAAERISRKWGIPVSVGYDEQISAGFDTAIGTA